MPWSTLSLEAARLSVRNVCKPHILHSLECGNKLGEQRLTVRTGKAEGARARAKEPEPVPKAQAAESKLQQVPLKEGC
jgi:hypothetical protein